MNIATSVVEGSPKSARLHGLILLLSAAWLLVAGAGCESRQVVPCGPPSADFTPTVWHCWDGGPLAYNVCNPPCGAAPASAPVPASAPEPVSAPKPPLAPHQPIPENPVPKNPPAPEPIPDAPSPPSVLPPGSPDSSQYRPRHYDGPIASDEKMHAAIEMARASVANFTNVLTSPRPNQSEFQICAAFSDGQKREYLWIRNVQFDGKYFSGAIGEVPQDIKNVQRAQRVAIAPTQIADWMYSENGILVGGFTLRALRESLSPADRLVLDNSVPFTIDSQSLCPERLVNFNSPIPPNNSPTPPNKK